MARAGTGVQGWALATTTRSCLCASSVAITPWRSRGRRRRSSPSHRSVASVLAPGGRIVVEFVSDSAGLAGMFADNWAQAGTDQERDATLYALARPARSYWLDETWDGHDGGRRTERP